MVDIKVPIRIIGALMWKADVIQEDNSKSNAWNANTDHTTLKTHGSIPKARLCEVTIQGSKEVAFAVIQRQFMNETCL